VIKLRHQIKERINAGHFSTFAKFYKIPQIYHNSEEKGKFYGSAQNSVARGKLWALVIIC